MLLIACARHACGPWYSDSPDLCPSKTEGSASLAEDICSMRQGALIHACLLLVYISSLTSLHRRRTRDVLGLAMFTMLAALHCTVLLQREVDRSLQSAGRFCRLPFMQKKLLKNDLRP